MRIIKYKKGAKGLYKVDLEDGTVLSLYEEVILKYNLLLTKDVDDSIKEEMFDYNLECGASMNRVTDLFTEDFNSDRRVQELVSKAKITNYSVATIVANQEDEYTREELAKAADYLLKFGVDAAFAVGKLGDNTVSISARSKERVNVGDVMHELEGGGNPFSAATKLTETTTEEAGKRLLKTITPPFYTSK